MNWKRRQSGDELLRLRGEGGRLRKLARMRTNWRSKNKALQGTLAQTSQSTLKTANPTPEADPERRVAIERMNQSRQLVLGLIMYAGDNQDTFPEFHFGYFKDASV